jgi:hypothetical protein
MKFREGFVSNSSSSSFVLVVKKEAYDLAAAEFDSTQLRFCEEFFDESNVLGHPCMVVSGETGNYRFYQDFYTDSEKYDGTSELWESIQNAFGKLPSGNVWSRHISD